MNRKATISLLLLLLGVLGMGATAPGAFAQGVTTATIRGEVVDENGEPLPGANVVAIHQPSGSQYGTSTNVDGRYTLPNVRVGGPYEVTASFVGYQSVRETDLQLGLGETRTLNFDVTTATAEMEEIEVIADRAAIFSRERTGIANSITEEDIDRAPTVSREIADFARLTPQAIVGNNDDDGSSISIAGQNNRYNSVFIDGSISNDVFGLSAQGTDGGQTGATPISIDAIEQFQIEISPFDVSQSFFGGGAINAITRSGTNQFEGSFAYERRGEALAGDLSSGDAFPDFGNNRYVGRIGGPIVKNKLFFFANVDILRQQTPQPFVGFNTFEGATLNNDAAVGGFVNFLDEAFGFNPGDFGTKNGLLDSDKVLGKIDWNISSNHRMSARYSYSSSDNVDAFRSTRRNLSFGGRNEVFPNTTQIGALELNSTFGSRFANKLILSYKDVEDDRDTNLDRPFPTVNIADGPADILFGGEPFSTVNFLKQEIFTLTNDFDVYVGDHTITLGTHNEFYDIANRFVPFNFGWYFYDSVDDFKQSACAALDDPSRVSDCAPFGPNPEPADVFVLRAFSLVDDDPNTPEFEEVIGDNTGAVGAFNALTLGFYVQDEWRVTDRLNLTAGIRVDIPKLLDNPRFANPADPLVPDDPDIDPRTTTIPAIEQFYRMNGAGPGRVPDATPHWAPRVGFNYDAFGDQTTQLRGGVGVFTSRQPFVWPGGMYLNNGTNSGQVGDFGPFEFRPDPNNGLTVEDTQGRDPSSLIPAGRLEMFEEDYKLPRFLRTSLGIDQRLPGGWVGSLEGQYTNTLKNINVTNVNLLPANGTLDGPDNRPIWIEEDYDNDAIGDFSRDQFIDGRYANIHRVGNTSRGYSYDVSARLRNTFEQLLDGPNALSVDVSYTYGDAYALNDGTSSQINSIWDGVEHVNGANNLELSRSDFSLGHRVLGRASYRQLFGRNVATTISLVYDGLSGRPFSQVISNSDEMVNESGDPNALLYVPRSASEFTFAPTTIGDATISPEQQAAALDQFISESDYLSQRRGQYAERNAERSPFEGVVDLNFKLELLGDLVGRQQKVEVTANIFNFSDMIGDLLGLDWGNRYFNSSQFQPLNFEEFVDPDNGDYTPVYTAQVLNVVDTDGDNVPDTFAGAIDQDDVFDLLETGSTYSAQWQMKFGVRYTF